MGGEAFSLLTKKYIGKILKKYKIFSLKKVKQTIYFKSLPQHQQFRMITQTLQRGNQLVRWMILSLINKKNCNSSLERKKNNLTRTTNYYIGMSFSYNEKLKMMKPVPKVLLEGG